MSEPTITVSVTEEREIAADHADLIVDIRGSALFTGDAALTKAREVAQMVADLRGLGLTDADIRLQAVHASASGGTFSRSSSATYTLLVKCASLTSLADILGVVTSQKNATLKQIVWKYPDTKKIDDQLLDACLQRANEKSRRIAAGLGVRLLGIASFQEQPANRQKGEWEDDSSSEMMYSLSRRRVTSEDLGFAVSHSKQVILRITVAYLVSRFAEESATPQRQRAPIPELP